MTATVKFIISDNELGTYEVTKALSSRKAARILSWIKHCWPVINESEAEGDIVTRPADTKESIAQCLQSTYDSWIRAGNDFALQKQIESAESSFEKDDIDD